MTERHACDTNDAHPSFPGPNAAPGPLGPAEPPPPPDSDPPDELPPPPPEPEPEPPLLELAPELLDPAEDPYPLAPDGWTYDAGVGCPAGTAVAAAGRGFDVCFGRLPERDLLGL